MSTVPRIKMPHIGYFEPKDDITPLESAWLAAILSICASPSPSALALVDPRVGEIERFIEFHNLRRHFKCE